MGVVILFPSPPARRRYRRALWIVLILSALFGGATGLYFAGKDLLRGAQQTPSSSARLS